MSERAQNAAEHAAGPSPTEAVNLDERKAAILRAVVHEHIETGQPVGSAHVSEAAKLHVSSATVRNEMNALERDGYLTHPHTSAGRIPTDRGYRYFVDSLDRGPTLRTVAPLNTHVGEFFDRAHGELGRLLDHTTRLLSELTEHTAVLMAPVQDSGQVIRSVQLVPLGAITLASGQQGEQVLLVTVLANASVEKVFLQLPDTASPARVAAATAHLDVLLVGSHVVNAGALSGQTGDPVVDEIVAVALNALSSPLASQPGHEHALLIGGAARIADSFDALQTVRSILTLLEEQFLVVSLLRETAKAGPGVSIGTEHAADHNYQALASCSLVVAPYRVDGRVAGSIGVLGPTRMNYPQVIAAVEAVSSGLSDHLNDDR